MLQKVWAQSPILPKNNLEGLWMLEGFQVMRGLLSQLWPCPCWKQPKSKRYGIPEAQDRRGQTVSISNLERCQARTHLHTKHQTIITLTLSYGNRNLNLTQVNITKHVGKVPSQPRCPFGSTHLDKGTKPKFCCRSLMRRKDLIEDVTHLAMWCNQLATNELFCFWSILQNPITCNFPNKPWTHPLCPTLKGGDQMSGLSAFSIINWSRRSDRIIWCSKAKSKTIFRV